MTEGDPFAGSLSGCDGCNASHCQDVSFLKGVCANERQWVWVGKGNVANCKGRARGWRFVADGNDVHGGGIGQVREGGGRVLGGGEGGVRRVSLRKLRRPRSSGRW